MGLPLGVIFDMDGVLVDSEPFICAAAMEMFAQRGVAVKAEDFLPFVGAGEDRYVGGVAEKYGLEFDPKRDKGRTYDIYDEMIKGKLKPLAGALEMIARCKEMGKKVAVASSADRRKVRSNLEAIGLAIDTFDAVVTGEDVERKKPWPDIFLLAANKLGLEPGQCLVVEDAVNGIAAAKKAGAKCLAVTTSFGADKLGEADWIVKSLAHLPAEVLNWK
ncbi:MAG: hypothetical protein A2Y12_04025 [Planctomycetes bacterium GWF2_42_9]|nr:MAG: hypothetical protein A2Y12_04025 [Planctomycetes bacterium GWF2_42_9]